jgi:hypothetical protein
MRLSILLIPLFAVGGNGCSSKSKPGSLVGPTALDAGDNRDASVVVGPDLGTSGAPVDLAQRDPAGPWPVTDLTIYGNAQGLGNAIVDANIDDAQNIWAASADTLYLLRPGATTFQAFTAADGLHIGPFTDPYGRPNQTSITAIAGGRANEVFVGYLGYETIGNPYNDTEAQKELGNGDRVSLGSDGKLAIVRYLFRCDYEGGNGCWENRSPRRILYARSGTATGHVFFGFNHGVSHVFQDSFGDHVHPEVWYHGDGGVTEKLGEFYGLAVLPTGDLWMAGRYGVGLQPWNPVPHFLWVDGRFIYAFTTDSGDHSLDVPTGYVENNRGAAVTADGTVWLARLGGGLVSWNPSTRTYATIRRWPGAPSDLLDVQADPDGTLWLVTSGGQLLRFDPASGTGQTWPGVGGVSRIYVDASVTPRAVYASMAGGVAVIRAK